MCKNLRGIFDPVWCAMCWISLILRAKHREGTTWKPTDMSSRGVQYIQAWLHSPNSLTDSTDLRAPNRREHTISTSVPEVRNRGNIPNISCGCMLRRRCTGGSAEQNGLLVYYTVLLESLQKLAPWKMLRSSRSTKSYHAMITRATIFHEELIPKRQQKGCVFRVSFFQMESLHNK